MTDDCFKLVRRSLLISIRNDRHLKEAHRIIDEVAILDENKLTDGQSAYLDVISDLTFRFESPAYEELMSNVTGVETLQRLMEEHGFSGSDIGRIVGHRKLGAKLLKGDRPITREHAKMLGRRFGLPSERFLG